VSTFLIRSRSVAYGELRSRKLLLESTVYLCRQIDLEAQIKALPLVQLEELGEVLLDFSQMSDLVAWFDR
jgi:Domain of unknown function (DUF4351)